MDNHRVEALRAKYLNAKYWPWPIAFAYCQTEDVRTASVDAAIEVLETYPGDYLESHAASGAIARAYEVATGRSYEGHPVERVDANGEPYTVKSGKQVYWEEIAEIELPLVDAIKAGQIDAWGRAAPHSKLDKLEATDWVGCEIHPSATCDLVKEGWRSKASDLSAVLGEIERHTISFDVHLLGAAVRQLVEAYDRRNAERRAPLLGDWENSDRIPREGYWSVFAVGAWIASRNDKFVAAVQEYEEAESLDRGGVYSSGGWLSLGDLMGDRFGITLSGAVGELRQALETGRLQGGVGREVNSATRPIERHEWKDWREAHERYGLALLPGIVDLAWPSDSVRQAFPTDTSKMAASSRLPGTRRALLPASAKPNDRKYEECAHRAAELVRSGAMTKQKAFAEVAPITEMVSPDSVIRAIRHAYDLMYDMRGEPIKN